MQCLILMAHGSRNEPANEEVRDLGRRLEREGCADRVVAAFLEAAPELPDAVAQQAAAGARTIVVLPLFLNTGNHVRRDIPRLIAQARAEYPEVEIEQLVHIGASSLYADFITRLTREALAGNENVRVS